MLYTVFMKNYVLYHPTVTALLLSAVWGLSAAAAVVDAPANEWNPVLYATSESSFDQQSGQTSMDIVGTSNSPACYIKFDDNKTANLTDGALAFRVRLNGVKNEKKASYNRVLQVGIDADLDGDLDLFVGVDHSASRNYNAIWQTGLGANTSPDTLSIASSPALTYKSLIGNNYHFAAVTALLDPTAQTFDVDGGGATDWFLSFSINFSDIVSQLSLKNISVDQNTHFGYIVTTSLKNGAGQQDVLGIDQSIGSALSWSELSAVSVPITPAGAMPEPTTGALIGVGFIGLLIRRHLSIG
jgi:hypothetical protein